uniref:Uncharacterized protein n=1 Tax=Nothobranchius furzeri TaxID=105023 RepID=A0A8C6VW48_NOTFU
SEQTATASGLVTGRPNISGDMANQEDPAVVAMPPSQLYREIKQESDLGRVYTREGSSPFSVGVKELKEEGAVGVASMGVAASCKVEANGEKSKTASFNRNQIIVEVNLNNQTLNVSKGSEGSATVTESMFGRRHDEQDSEGDEDNDAENIGVGEEDVEVLKRTDLLGNQHGGVGMMVCDSFYRIYHNMESALLFFYFSG